MESKRENVKEKNTTQDTINRISTSTNWINPLSQTFLVDRNENPNGIYASSIDIFFAGVSPHMGIQYPIVCMIMFNHYAMCHGYALSLLIVC